jgi:signal transduction histidine kinase
MVSAVLEYLPRGNTLSDEAWSKRHLLLQWLLLLHVPGLFVFGVARGYSLQEVSGTVAVPFALLIVARIMHTRRLASFFVTAGLVYCSAALVALSGGAIEAHFHFFIMIGFIALYQDWVPFLWNIIFTVLSHGFGSAFRSNLIFDHHAAIAHPWTWSLVHGLAVLAACVGVVLFWKQTEEEQNKTLELREQLATAEIGRRRFTSDLLVNLARRNQNLLYRQLDLLNQLEENEGDPDALADLFQLDHLATRIRRNAESLLVLSGEEPARKWGRPVALADVVRAAIAETEDLDRVDFAVDESLAVSGRAVADLTHLLAELIENAVHFSPPAMAVMVRSRNYLPAPGAQVLTIEDWGVGMSPEEFAAVNDQLANPRDVDLSTSQRLGLHVVARLAQRYGIAVSVTPTPGGGVTAVVLLPAELFDPREEEPEFLSSRRVPAPMSAPAAPIEPAARTVTFAPPMPAITAPPAPPYLRPMAEPFAPANGAPDDWNSWWTPQPRINGHAGADTRPPAPLTDLAPPPRSAPFPDTGRFPDSGPFTDTGRFPDSGPFTDTGRFPDSGSFTGHGPPPRPGEPQGFRPSPPPGEFPPAGPPPGTRPDGRPEDFRTQREDRPDDRPDSFRTRPDGTPDNFRAQPDDRTDRGPGNFRTQPEDRPDDFRTQPGTRPDDFRTDFPRSDLPSPGLPPRDTLQPPPPPTAPPLRRWNPEPIGSAGGPGDRPPAGGEGATALHEPGGARPGHQPDRSHQPDRAATPEPGWDGRPTDASPVPASSTPAATPPTDSAPTDSAPMETWPSPAGSQPAGPSTAAPAPADLTSPEPTPPAGNGTGSATAGNGTAGDGAVGNGMTAPAAAGAPAGGGGTGPESFVAGPGGESARGGAPSVGAESAGIDAAGAGGIEPDAGSGTAGAGAAEESPRLSRRVPLANLAEGLRRGQEPAGGQPQLIRDPAQAREALSRFQASQRAARAMLDGIGRPNDDSGGDRQD